LGCPAGYEDSSGGSGVSFNHDVVDRYALKPAATAWDRFLTPDARQALGRAADNLGMPRRAALPNLGKCRITACCPGSRTPMNSPIYQWQCACYRTALSSRSEGQEPAMIDRLIVTLRVGPEEVGREDDHRALL